MSQPIAEPRAFIPLPTRPDVDKPPGRPPPLAVRSHGLTDRGRLSNRNQDQFLIAVLAKVLAVEQTSLSQPRLQFSSDQGHLFVVADGMGGPAAGKQASALATGTVEEFMLQTLKWFYQLKGEEGNELLSEFQKVLGYADSKLITEAQQHPELAGMGTTLTLAYSIGDELLVAHVGDSRCYLLRGPSLYRLTRDHTVVDDMVRLGYVHPERAAGHELRHVVANVVGRGSPGVQVEVHKVHLERDDVLLLCSDGLTEMVSDENITATLQEECEPAAACERLVALANERGGKDNITVIVTRYGEPSSVSCRVKSGER